jgi:4-amino-4-deoxy-L-arabinose transferase-like glycosyltransferase
MSTFLRAHAGAVGIAGLFAALGTLYSVVTPIFEASDEFLHYPVIQHIAETGRLPVQQPGIRTLWDQEGSQPPLYYFIGAAATFWIDTSDLEQVRWLNPHRKFGIASDPDNKNLIIHTPAEAFPWRGTVLAVHLIRLISVAMCTAAVALVYTLVRTLWPDQHWIALLAAALTAFNPMFLFITGSVNNDNLMVLLGTWTLLLVVRVIAEGVTAQRAIMLAVVAALGTLTKLSGLSLLPLVGLALIIHALRTGQWRSTILTGIGIVVAFALIAGWWYLRNLRLYGELLGTETMVAIAGRRETPVTLWDLRREWYGFWVAYWGLFGAVSILADAIFYRFLAAVSWIAVAGLGWWAALRIRARAWRDLLIPGLLALQILITLAGVLRWTLMTYGSQGRLMFPVIAAISALMALGLLNWIPERLRAGTVALISVPLLAGAAITPFRYIAPAYAAPPIVASVPGDATPIGVTYDGLEIVAASVGSASTETGGRVPVTLYLRANEPLDANYSLYLHMLNAEGAEVGRLNTYPGGGALPTTQMQPGMIYRDTYSLRTDPALDAASPPRVAVGVGLWQHPLQIVLNGQAPDGSPVQYIVLEGRRAHLGAPGSSPYPGSAVPAMTAYVEGL